MTVLETANRIVWGAPALVLILGVGLYLTIRTGFSQFWLFPKALKSLLLQCKASGSGYRALCTALAATVGTGNLAGVAGAIALGGPGAVFWMWVSGIVGMATKMAEAVLAIRYRHKEQNGEYIGGPMYMIRKGMDRRWHFLAGCYCFFGVVASFGVGNATQINAVICALETTADAFGLQFPAGIRIFFGILLGCLLCTLLLGGSRRIGAAAERLVPVASLGYLILCGVTIALCYPMIPKAMYAIFRGAWNPGAVTGGMLGSAFCAMRVGTARGVFTNEAGMGTASIAHAGAEVRHPVEQGMMGIIEVFIDTIVICTMTALVILCSGIPIPYGADVGIELTEAAFSAVCGKWVVFPITLALCLFAIATVLGWGLYGMRCAQYLFGQLVWKKFVYLQGGMVVVGATLGTGTLWLFAEIVNGLMSIPSLVAVAVLSPELLRILKEYKSCS